MNGTLLHLYKTTCEIYHFFFQSWKCEIFSINGLFNIFYSIRKKYIINIKNKVISVTTFVEDEYKGLHF